MGIVEIVRISPPTEMLASRYRPVYRHSFKRQIGFSNSEGLPERGRSQTEVKSGLQRPRNARSGQLMPILGY